jgi:biotin-(acetyl-CoA carboxylase) ligase
MSVRAPSLPPLFSGKAVTGSTDPFAKACADAALGCDAGLVVHNLSEDWLRAAIVFAPEEPLEEAMAVLPACGIGFQNALGALAPPEVAVHLDWTGFITVNAARCGRLRVAASTVAPTSEPDWIVVGLEIPLIPVNPEDPGLMPDETSLFEEGCVEVDPMHLLEAWARHTLLWISRLLEDGREPLHREWRGLARNVGEDVDFVLKGKRQNGTFVGVDENFGMLLRTDDQTSLIPLSRVLETEEST